jgi:hypothetical protein
MLLAAQMTFGWRKEEPVSINNFVPQPTELVVDPPKYETDDGPLTNEQLHQIAQAVKTVKPDLAEKIEQLADTHTEAIPPTPSTALGGDITAPEETVEGTSIEQWNKMIEEAEKAVEDEKKALVEPDFPETEESKKKTYMTKDETGKIQIKDRS